MIPDGLKTVVLGLADSPLADKLILRGSVPMRVWFGEKAREPQDVDYILADPDLEWDSPEHDQLCWAVEDVLGPWDDVDEIQYYPTDMGQRLIYPDGSIDMSFGVRLNLPPESIEVDGVRVTVASRTESLAWKLLWLVAEKPNRPKDLYDAVLLAESMDPDPALTLARRLVAEQPVDDVLTSSWEDHTPDPDSWEAAGFLGDPDEWMRRLSAACGPWSDEEDGK